MAVVLAAMGFYGAGYLGWAIRTSDDDDLVEKAKDLHPKVLCVCIDGHAHSMVMMELSHPTTIPSPCNTQTHTVGCGHEHLFCIGCSWWVAQSDNAGQAHL